MISLMMRSAISFLAPVSFRLSKNARHVAQRRAGDFVDRALLLAVADLHVARFDAQARAVAGRAFLLVDELGQFFLAPPSNRFRGSAAAGC